jgi:hypothetical protein
MQQHPYKVQGMTPHSKGTLELTPRKKSGGPNACGPPLLKPEA